MHAPDGYLSAGTAVTTGVLSVGTIGAALRQAKHTIKDKQIPLAGIAAAFIFAAQMFNFPVAAGTTGHLMGGALAAVLLGPSMGAIVVTIVVVLQALAFADGGLTALGYNVFNMAIVTAFGGWAVFKLSRKFLPKSSGGVVAATGIAALVSVILSAMSFSVMWLFGATAPIPFDTVFGSMVGIHVLIGVGEAVISALAVAAVMASRPDLVYGAQDLDAAQLSAPSKVPTRAFVAGGMVVALVFAVVVSQFAVDNPDGLEWVAEETGFVDQGTDHALGDFIFADYATAGVGNETLSLAIAGIVGVVLSLAVGYGLFSAIHDRTGKPPETASV